MHDVERNSTGHILPIIVIAQFCCTSLWFAGNAVMDELVLSFGLSSDVLQHLTSAVQFGFIIGTLIFAILTLADRFSPSLIFFICAIGGSLANLLPLLGEGSLPLLLCSRGLTGFALAGIYPVGMKIAADYYDKGLGRSLGYLVGALVLGTAFPHLIKHLSIDLEGGIVLMATSAIALLGGASIWLFVPDGPFRKKGSPFNPSALVYVFSRKRFRSAAFGYFGHMWELYTFWAFVPVLLATHSNDIDNISLWTFTIIGIGAPACVLGGYLSGRWGAGKVARLALVASLGCCILAPFSLYWHPVVSMLFFCFWGMVVIADSPLFSTLVAKNADADYKGTALTIVTCIGFGITIVSIQLLGYLNTHFNSPYIWIFLGIGPLIGILCCRKMD